MPPGSFSISNTVQRYPRNDRKCAAVSPTHYVSKDNPPILILHGTHDALPKGSKVRLTDTRKTTPGLRLLDRYAVRNTGADAPGVPLDIAWIGSPATVQYLQLLHGAGRPAVRARGTMKALYELQRAVVVTLDQYRVFDEGYRFLRSLDVRLRISHDSSIDTFDPQMLDPGILERYRVETERIRKVYLELLGLPGA